MVTERERMGKILAFVVIFVLAAVHLADAQSGKMHTVGRLASGSPSDPVSVSHLNAFRQRLRDLGWTEGKNLAIEPRWARGDVDRFVPLAAELVRLRVDVIVANGSHAIRASKEATAVIPIVMAAAGDPLAQNFVSNYAKPEGNMTGLSLLTRELAGKRLELLREIVPDAKRIAVLGNAASPTKASQWNEVEAAAHAMGFQLHVPEVRGSKDLGNAFSSMRKVRARALLVLADPVVLERDQQRIVDLVLEHRLPAIYPWSSYPDIGGLMAYGTSLLDMHRRSAYYVDKILKGAKPAELPVEQPTKIELVINLKTANQIGRTIPQRVLARADRVIR
jgi:putative tryptophan/tyrosine transport system substrate-binding protein